MRVEIFIIDVYLTYCVKCCKAKKLFKGQEHITWDIFAVEDSLRYLK